MKSHTALSQTSQIFTKLLTLAMVLTLIFACSQETLTDAQSIAKAHGIDNWHKVKTFQFTFGGSAEDPNSGRAWTWDPSANDITLIRNGETINYNRNDMDSVAIKSDRAFINDKFWALIPYQLVWDSSAAISETTQTTSPVKGESLNKLTITYPSEGGYTPGDAYDIYFDNEFIIREWSFRRGNQEEPSLSNTFENYGDFNGLKIAQEHKRSEGDWNLLVRNVKVELND